MYSRSEHGRETPPYRIPDNYRGNAFTPMEEPIVETAPPAPLPKTLPTETKPAEAKPVSLLSSLLPPTPSGALSIFGNIGFEELLILGIILLLSGSEKDDDILLLLILLLFYK